MILLITMVLQNLVKNTFNLGFFKFTDQTKMEIFMGMKGFVLVFAGLRVADSKVFFDYDLRKEHKELNDRLNQALAPFLVQAKEVPPEFTYFVFALMASILSFSVVRMHVKFAYYFFFFTSQEEKQVESTGDEVHDKIVKFSNRMDNLIKAFLYLNFILPMLVFVLFVNPLARQMLVPTYLSSQSFMMFRLTFILIACFSRGLTFREELQFQFNESYHLVQRLMLDKNAQLFKYIKLRIQENFLSIWYNTFQQCSPVILPTLLVLAYIQKLISPLGSGNQQTTYATTGQSPDQPIYFEFPELRKAYMNKQEPINLFAVENKELMIEVVNEISKGGIVPHSYYLALLEFCIVWYFFITTFITSMALVYYRKFKAV